MALSIEKDVFPQQFSTNVRVLVIDHDINHLNNIEKMCSQFQYPVKTCSKVFEALNLLMDKMDCFDVVLLEAQMPDMNSYDFLQYVTEQIDIPVIMMCVDEAVSDVKKAIENGVCIYWIKPLSENQIRYMWKYVALKIWNKKKEKEIDECMKKKEKDKSDKDKHESSMEKTRLAWTPELHKLFVNAVMELNIDTAVPTTILDKMNVAGLTREQVASHLQKFRLYLKEKEAERQEQIQLNSALCLSFSHPMLQQNPMMYGCSSSQQFPNNLIARNFPPHFNNSFNNLYQTGSVSVNQQNCGGFGTDAIINPYFQETQGGSLFLEYISQHSPMAQPFPMSSSTIGASRPSGGLSPIGVANIGDINANLIRAEVKELDSSLQKDVMKPKEGTIQEASESANKVEGTQNLHGMNFVTNVELLNTNSAETKELRRGTRSRKPNILLKDYVRE